MPRTDPIAEPPAPLSLTGLQRILDRLQVGEQIAIAITDYRRMFGENDLSQARLENFAQGHGCRIDAGPSSVTFRKVRRTGP